MASARRPYRKRNDDRMNYARIMRDLILTGRATTLHDVTQVVGTRPVQSETVDDRGQPVTLVLEVPVKRLLSVEYDDPGPRSPRDATNDRDRTR